MIGELKITSYPFLFFLWLDIIALTTLFILKTQKDLSTLNVCLNIAAVCLFFLPLISLGIYEYKSENILEQIKSENYNWAKKTENVDFPDIYYIIFDGYARADILKEIYGFDNSDFISYLTNKGFYVAHQSNANYPQTYLSIASSLNFDYINHLSDIVGENSSNRKPLYKMVINNKVYKMLKSEGYLFVSVPGTWTEKNLYADIHLHANKMDLNDFDNALLNITPLGIVLGKQIQLNLRRKKLTFSFNHLPDIAKINSPTFVYAHFVIPHPPFIFGKNGEPITPRGLVIEKDGSHYFKIIPGEKEYRRKYKNQLVFINKKIREMIDKILDTSNKAPIIILQYDHGPGTLTDWENPGNTNMQERLSILNAYYLPEEGKKFLYQSITPVNTFRIIFNCVFNTNFEILNDESYFATWSHPYKFINITEELSTE